MRVLKAHKFFLKIITILLVIIIIGIIHSCTQEISITPPDEPPPHGYVLIDSKPNAAHIYLDGKDRRRITPDSLTWLETNQYIVTLKKELYRDTSIIINAVDGERKQYFVDYTQNPAMRGKINCNAKPDGSEIFLNDSATGKVTPDVLSNLLPGYYKVRFHAQNHRDDSLTVTVSSSNITTAKITLVDTTVWMDLNTQTSNIPTNYLTCISIDNNNNLWIGTEDQGLIKFDGNIWQQYSSATSIIQTSKVNAVNVNDDGIVWTGNKFGLFIINSNDNTVTRYNDINYGFPLTDWYIVDISLIPPKNEMITTKKTILIANSIRANDFVLKNREVFGITDTLTTASTDKFGTQFIGTSQTGVFVGGTSKRLFNTTNSSIIGNNVTAVTPDPINGGAWIGFKSGAALGTGISYFNNNIFQSYYILQNGGSTNSIYVDKYDMKWVGTTAGLITFTNSAADVKIYSKENTGLEINDVRGVIIDKLGRTWIATFGGGLILKKK